MAGFFLAAVGAGGGATSPEAGWAGGSDWIGAATDFAGSCFLGRTAASGGGAGVSVAVGEAVSLGVEVGVEVSVGGIPVSVGVGVGGIVEVKVGVGVWVDEGARVGMGVQVGVAVSVGRGVSVSAGTAACGALPGPFSCAVEDSSTDSEEWTGEGSRRIERTVV